MIFIPRKEECIGSIAIVDDSGEVGTIFDLPFVEGFGSLDRDISEVRAASAPFSVFLPTGASAISGGSNCCCLWSLFWPSLLRELSHR